jgi:hypothetical protein
MMSTKVGIMYEVRIYPTSNKDYFITPFTYRNRIQAVNKVKSLWRENKKAQLHRREIMK